MNWLDKYKEKLTNEWFFSDANKLVRVFEIYVKGDQLVLLPVVFVILLTGFLSLRFMVLMFGVYLAVRGLGEMIYWLLQQFGDRTYRPGDKGYKNLDNNAIYILYQTLALRNTVIGIGIALLVVLYWY